MIADGLEPRADSENLLHRLGAYAGNTGNIVHGISGERLHIGLKIGTKPVFFLIGLGRDQFFLLGAGVPHDHVGAEALPEVLVPGNDDNGMLSGKTRSQGGNAIVRFKAFRFLIMNAQGVNHALDRL